MSVLISLTGLSGSTVTHYNKRWIARFPSSPHSRFKQGHELLAAGGTHPVKAAHNAALPPLQGGE